MNRKEVSEVVLQAARTALPANAQEKYHGFSEKQRPLIPLFVALLDSTQAIASAIADNAWDDHEPINSDFVKECKRQAQWISGELSNATECPDRANWETV